VLILLFGFSANCFGEAVLKKTPNNAELKKVCSEIMKKISPSVIVEDITIIKKPDSWVKGKWTQEETVKLLNAITSISTLRGLQYYSSSRKKMRTFYESSVVIKNLDTKTESPDPVFDTKKRPPDFFMLYAMQKDLSFGENIYSYKYYVKDDFIYFVQENETAMKYGIIPVLQAKNLNVVVAFIDQGDAICVYIATMAKALMLPGVEGKVSSSFKNRADALFKWLKDKKL
jgi:hypothetical protein